MPSPLPSWVWIVMPVYNHTDSAKKLAERLVADYGERIVIIDDGSTDVRLSEVLADLPIHFLTHQQNQGKGKALQTAASYISSKGGKTMISLDADGQHDPADLEKFLPLLKNESNSEIILGTRDFSNQWIPCCSRLGRSLSNYAIYLETGIELGDSQSGFRVYPVKLFEQLVCQASRFGFETEILVRATWAEIEIHEIDISVDYPRGADRISHFHPLLDNLRICLLHLKLLGEKICKKDDSIDIFPEPPTEVPESKVHNQNRLLIYIVVSLLGTLLVGAIGVWLIRDYGKENLVAQANIRPVDKNSASNWLQAVKNGDRKRALLIARQMTPEFTTQVPRLDYLLLLKQNQLHTRILSDSFNRVDFLRWKDAMALKKLADNLIKDRKTAVPDLCQAVIEKIKLNPNKKPPTEVMTIWKQGEGSCSDRIRLLASLAEQVGIDNKTAVLFDEKGKMIFLLCELWDRGTPYIMDCQSGRFWPNCSIEKLSGDPKLSPKLKQALERKILFLQLSEFADYRVGNQLIAKKLSGLSLPGLPSFGEDPQDRLERFINRRQLPSDKFIFRYWQMPFKAVKNLPSLPKTWIYPKNPEKKNGK